MPRIVTGRRRRSLADILIVMVIISAATVAGVAFGFWVADLREPPHTCHPLDELLG